MRCHWNSLCPSSENLIYTLQQDPDIKHPSIPPKKSGNMLASIENLSMDCVRLMMCL